MTLRLVLAAYGLENVRPYRVAAGRNNEHWYVGAGLVLRRYSPFRSDAAIDYEHAIVGQLRERGWPVAVRFRPMRGAWWLLMTVAAIPCFRGGPGAAASRGGRGSFGSLAGFWAGCIVIWLLFRSRGHRMPFRRFSRCPPTRPGNISTPWTTRS